MFFFVACVVDFYLLLVGLACSVCVGVGVGGKCHSFKPLDLGVRTHFLRHRVCRQHLERQMWAD